MRKIILCLFVLFNIFCKEANRKIEKEVSTERESIGTVNMDKEIKKIDLEFLSEEYFPDGCGGVFSFDKIYFDKNQFVLIYNLEKCFFKIKDKVVEANYLKDMNGFKYFENDEYLIKIKLNITKEFDEGGFYQCELNILIKKENANLNYKLVGEDGC